MVLGYDELENFIIKHCLRLKITHGGIFGAFGDKQKHYTCTIVSNNRTIVISGRLYKVYSELKGYV